MAYDAIIIGGGAAGLFCAFTAGRRGKSVLVIEHNAEVGRKIIISGGGRCNFTNTHTTAENFLSQNPHFCKSALSRYTPRDLVELVKKHKIPFYEKKLGQLFCRDNSRAIVDMLLGECRDARVEIRTACSVANVGHEHGVFSVETNQGRFEAEKLVIACGGLSFPKIGATDFGYRVARQFGLKIVQTRASLVAMVCEDENYKHLAGVSIDSKISVKNQSFRENILFTHRGLSGPAILQASNYWDRDAAMSIDLLPDIETARLFADGDKRKLSNVLGTVLPQRFADEFATREFGDRPVYQMNEREREELRQKLTSWQVKVRDTEGYGRAEVTLGGISTDELSSKTMGSKQMFGLYFIGEVVDVTGWLGGYNFQWAWASGHAAGTAI